MKPHPSLKTYHTGQTGMLESYGSEIWDTITAERRFYEPFRTKDAAARVAAAMGFAPKTALLYTTAVLHNVLLDQDQDNPCLIRLPAARWQLPRVQYD